MKSKKTKQTKTIRPLFIVLAIVWMIVIFLFSAQTGAESGSLSTGIALALDRVFHITRIMPFTMLTFFIRKAAHMTEYAILGILLLNIVKVERMTMKTAIGALFICALYAASDEWHQTFIAARAGQPRDVLIDSIGALIGIVLCFVIRRYLLKRQNNRNYKKDTKEI